MAYNERLAERMREILQDTRGVVEKKMFGGIAFMWKDRMFCGIIKEDLMVRVLDEQYDELVQRNHARPMDFVKARPMRGFIYVSLDGVKSEKQLSLWIEWGKKYVEKSPAKRMLPKKVPLKKIKPK